MSVKSANTQTREHAIGAAIREISHIATLPEITLKIISLVEDPTSTAQELHKVIANDPALCSRILKVVNSAFYGLPGQIGSINRAIVLLGLNAVKNIAIAASLARLFRGGALTPNFDAKNLWQHSISTAAACKMIAGSMKLGLADEAFLAGLIHDIGLIVEIQYDRNKMIEVIAATMPQGCAAPQRDMLTVEQEVFGASHQEFGLALCEKWKFPKSFINVTGFHHRPLEMPEEGRTLVCLVWVADRLAAGLKDGFRMDLLSTDITLDVLDHLHLTREAVDDIAARLPDHLQTVEKMLA